MNFEILLGFLYEIYKNTFIDYYKTKKQYPDDYSPYRKLAGRHQGFVKDKCINICFEYISKSDIDFFQEQLSYYLSIEEIPMLDILSDYFLEHGAKIDHRCYDTYMEKCLDILEKNGTDMEANHVPAYLYERLITTSPAPIDIKKRLTFFKRIINLPYNDVWLDVPACYSIHYKTMEFMRETKEDFDCLVNFMVLIEDSQLKGMVKEHLQCWFVDR